MTNAKKLQKILDNDMGAFLMEAKKELTPAIIQKIISGKRNGISVEEILKQNGLQ